MYVELLLLLALWLFAVTHLDTLFVLIAFCSDAQYEFPEIFVGHYVGFSIGLLVAVVGSIIAADALSGVGFLLGVVPLGMGILGFYTRETSVETSDHGEFVDRFSRGVIVTAAGVGLSGENIAVFVPFFLRLTRSELVAVIGLYVLAAGVLFVIAFAIAQRTAKLALPTWIEQYLVPGTLTLVGSYVLLSGWLGLYA